MFVCLYMGSSSLYKTALESFQKSSNPEALVEISGAMQKLMYAMALYYQGYMTQEELADRSGVAVTGIVNYESGGSGATLDTACKLAEALKCTPNDLIGWNC